MSISILNRGASGGLKPELTVTAPSGSTVDLLQNGIIIATYTLGVSETEHTFVVKVGTYTVRGTLGDKVQNKEAHIEIAGQYEVEINYKLWLYREGDECEDVTGGWYQNTNYTYSNGIFNNSSYVLRKNADNLELPSYGTSCSNATTKNKIDFSVYSKLFVDAITVSTETHLVTAASANTTGNLQTNVIANLNPTSTRAVYEINVSTLNDERYLVFMSYSARHNKVYRAWLE